MSTGGRVANDAWEALLSAHARLMRGFAAEKIWTEVSMREYDVLYTLAKSQHPIRQRELTERVLLSQPALSRMLDRLDRRGLIERRVDRDDGRSVRVSLTDQGRALQRRIGRLHARDVARAMTARLNTDELRRLQEICRKLAAPNAVAERTDKDIHR